MRKAKVNIKEGYPIYIGCDILLELAAVLEESGISSLSKLVIVTDTNVAPLHVNKVKETLLQEGYVVRLVVIPAGEESKSMECILNIIGNCLRFGLDRSGVILALGGGVVGDVAGFVAATYMRGVRYVQLPTTIIAHDSSIGGKVGVNHQLGKNIIGAFYQPQLIFFDVSFLQTLPLDERISGYAEMIKHGLIYDERFVSWLENNCKMLLALDLRTVEEALYHSCKIKASIVSMDEKENGLRMILNYGHTIAHALEAVTNYGYYKHGEAVSIGLYGATHISQQIFGESVDGLRVKELLSSFCLPLTTNNACSNQDLLYAMRKDKKRKDDKYIFVLSPKIGEAKINPVIEAYVLEGLNKIRA